VQSRIQPERTGTDKNPTEDQADQKQIQAAAAEEVTVQKRQECRTQRSAAAREMHRKVIELDRHFQEVGEHENKSSQQPAREPSQARDQFSLEETPENRLLQRWNKERRREGNQ